MKHEEDENQRALIKWATLATPRIPQLALLFAVPNGGRRDAREAARLKGTGVKAGVPDLLFPYRHGYCNGLAIEMKSTKGRVTPDQAKWHDMLRNAGWQVNVCRSWQEAREVICKYLDVRP